MRGRVGGSGKHHTSTGHNPAVRRPRPQLAYIKGIRLNALCAQCLLHDDLELLLLLRLWVHGQCTGSARAGGLLLSSGGVWVSGVAGAEYAAAAEGTALAEGSSDSGGAAQPHTVIVSDLAMMGTMLTRLCRARMKATSMCLRRCGAIK